MKCCFCLRIADWHSTPPALNRPSLSASVNDNGRSTWHNQILGVENFAMQLRRGEVRGYDFNRMVVEFTMLNQDKVIYCAISTAAMDDLEGKRDVKPHQRLDQFMRLREVIEEQASRKFFEQLRVDRPVILRSNDFSIAASLRPHRN
jgi:hypothetical protein